MNFSKEVAIEWCWMKPYFRNNNDGVHFLFDVAPFLVFYLNWRRNFFSRLINFWYVYLTNQLWKGTCLRMFRIGFESEAKAHEENSSEVLHGMEKYKASSVCILQRIYNQDVIKKVPSTAKLCLRVSDGLSKNVFTVYGSSQLKVNACGLGDRKPQNLRRVQRTL